MVAEVIFALLLGLIVAALLVPVMGRRGPGPGAGFVLFFLLAFLFIWAGGLWVTPVGPAVWGVSWITFLFITLVVFLLLVALVPPTIRPATTVRSEEETAAMALGVLFWVLLLFLVIAVIAAYI